ncbi:MAG: hypothetical protein WBP45_16005 [Daejeonella sp.]
MGSTSETGHNKNVANFKDLTISVQALGAIYKPSKTNLQLPNLQALLSPAETAIKTISEVTPHYQLAVDAQELLFWEFRTLPARVMNIFRSSVENPEEVQSAQNLVKLIRGDGKYKKKSDKALTEETTPKGKSTSRRSYDSIMENFQKFIDILIAHPLYDPNEEEFKTATLTALLDDMKAKNEAVSVLETPINDARKERDLLLYTPGTGMVAVGKAVKIYVRGILKPEDPHYKAIMAIEFKNI